MDPIANPTPTPNPGAPMGATPTPSTTPTVPTTSPVVGADSLAGMEIVSAGGTSVGASAEPVLVGQPLNVSTAPATVNPVFNPATTATPGTNTVLNSAGGFDSTGAGDGLMFDPLIQREPVAEPDPVEEELKKPMKAAEPVPGSIGSAISVPEGGVAPTAEPTAAASMVATTPTAPTSTPSAPVAPAMPGATPTTEAPITPTAPVAPAVTVNVSAGQGAGTMVGGNPVAGAPVAAAPVAMPANQAPQQTPSVSFSDPAMEANAGQAGKQDDNTMAAGVSTQTKKKFNLKMDKRTLILLCVVAGLVVVALVIVLIMVINEQN